MTRGNRRAGSPTFESCPDADRTRAKAHTAQPGAAVCGFRLQSRMRAAFSSRNTYVQTSAGNMPARQARSRPTNL